MACRFDPLIRFVPSRKPSHLIAVEQEHPRIQQRLGCLTAQQSDRPRRIFPAAIDDRGHGNPDQVCQHSWWFVPLWSGQDWAIQVID